MCCPDGGPSKIVAISPPGSAFSIGTTVSAPAGIGAPVAMRTASPPPTTASGRRPIRALPTIFSSIGDAGVAPATSEERTANPSIADDANSGRSRSATTSSAATHPYASVSGSCSDASGWICARTFLRASSTESSPLTSS